MTEGSAARKPQNVDVIADEIPDRHLGKAGKQRLRKLAKALDDVGRLDEKSGKVMLYEPAVKRLLGDRELVPEAFGKKALAALKGSEAEDVLTSDEQGKRRVAWAELVERGDGPTPDTDLSFRALGLSESSSEEDMREAVRRHYPDLPPEAFEGDELRTRIETVLAGREPPGRAGEAAPRDLALWWDCVKRKLGGWWFWILAGALVAFAAALPNVWLGAILAGAWLGAWALAIAIGCAINPFW